MSAYSTSMVKVPDLKKVSIFVLGTELPLGKTMLEDTTSVGAPPSSVSGAEPFQAKAMEKGNAS